MYLRMRTVLNKKKNRDLVDYIEELSVKSTALYNATLFRIRQVFTGWTKDPASLSRNEKDMFAEKVITEKANPGLAIRRTPSYKAMEKWMRACHVPEFFDDLPMQTAQRVVKQAVLDFNNWLKSCRSYKKNPSSFTGKPKMPKYKKRGTFMTFECSNQDAVLYERDLSALQATEHKGKQPDSDKVFYELKLPLTKLRLPVSGIQDPSDLINVCLKPFYDSWLVFLDFRIPEEEPDPEQTAFRLSGKHMAAIDFGVDNIASLAVNDAYGLICKGSALKSEIRLFCKERAKAVSLITHGHENMPAHSRHLDYISIQHKNFMDDQCHQISRYIINTCIRHQVGILVLGISKGWKQNSGMIKQNNQMFEYMPIAKLRDMITYKAQMAGILVVEQEESYTSRADFLKNDVIPVFGTAGANTVSFSGHRRKRGLYVSGTGDVINADMNAAANILRKAFPKAFAKTKDTAFLKDPEVLTFKKLMEIRPSKKKTA